MQSPGLMHVHAYLVKNNMHVETRAGAGQAAKIEAPVHHLERRM